MSVLQTIVRTRTTVLPGGVIIVSDPALQSGEAVEVLILLTGNGEASVRTAVDILGEAEGHRLFRSADEVDRYLHEERASWDI